MFLSVFILRSLIVDVITEGLPKFMEKIRQIRKSVFYTHRHFLREDVMHGFPGDDRQVI